MKLVDANVLLFAKNADAPLHAEARNWLDTALNGVEPVVLPALCTVAFVRLATHPNVFSTPLSIDAAIDQVRDWLGAPAGEVRHPGPPACSTVCTASI